MIAIENMKGRQTKLLAAIAVFAMVACVFAMVAPADDVQGAEIPVSDYKGLSEALENAEPGDTIALSTGNYGSSEKYETITVDKSVTLKAAANATPVIYGSIVVKADDVVIDGLMINITYMENTERNAVNILSSSATVKNCTINMDEDSTNLCNGVCIWPKQSNTQNYVISNNTFNNLQDTKDWASVAILVAEKLNLNSYTERFGEVSGTSSTLDMSMEEVFRMVSGNTYNGCSWKYSSTDYTAAKTGLRVIGDFEGEYGQDMDYFSVEGTTYTLLNQTSNSLELALVSGEKFVVAEGVTFSGSVSFTDSNATTNKITISGVTAGEGGFSISEGSVVLTGNMTAAETNAEIIQASGDVVLRDLTVTDGGEVKLSGTIAIEGNVSIPNATAGDNMKITVAEDAVVELPALVLAKMTYKDGATVIINNLEYTIYNKVLSTNLGKNVSFAVGVAISNPVYDGGEVTLRDISPQVILISVEDGDERGATYSARFEASQTKIVDGPAINVGTYKVEVAVELNYNGDTNGNVSTYFCPTASFSIVSPEPGVILKMEEWNVYVGYDPSENAPTFEYVLNGVKYTNETENPFTVTYTLIKDGTKYAQDQWGSIDTAGTYTLEAVFSSWNDGNYKSVTKEINVNLYAGTEGSEMVFSETDLSEVYGVYVDRLQTGITVTSDANIKVSGTVYYLASFPGFWGEADDKPGYYVVFDAVAKNQSSQSIVTVTGSGGTKTLTGTEYDGYWVLYLGDISETTPALTQEFTITYDADGDGTLYTKTTYTINLSGITPVENYPLKVILSDERNATEEIDATFLVNEGYIQLPNAAGDVGWLTETGFFYAAGSMVKIDESLDVDGNGRIVFTAQYGSTPVQPEEPATEIYIGIVKNETGVVITIVGLTADEEYGYIPAGQISIEYTTVAWTSMGDVQIPMPQAPVTVTEEVSEGQMIVKIPVEDFSSYDSIIGMNVSFSVDGTVVAKNTASYDIVLTAPTA